MSLITRCPACETLFKVVPDQLRISQGWVRCGQCGEIFDASADLRQYEAGPAAAQPLDAPRPVDTVQVTLPQEPLAPAPNPVAAWVEPAVDIELAFPEEQAALAETDIQPEPEIAVEEPVAVQEQALQPDEHVAVEEAVAEAAAPGEHVEHRQVHEEPAVERVDERGADVPHEAEVTVAEAEAESEFDSEPELVAGEIEPVPEPELASPEPLDDLQPVAESLIEPEPEPEAGAEAEASVVVEAESASKTESTPETSIDAEAEPEPEPESGADGEAEAKKRVESETEPEAELLAEAASPDHAPGSSSPMPLPGRAALDVLAEGATVAATSPHPEFNHHDVSFIRQAPNPETRRRSSLHRALWVFAGVTALVALLLQMALHERDSIAAAAPALRPLLQTLCAPLQCSVQAPREIEAVVIDGSSFSALRNEGYKLSLTLRNRAAHALAVPAIELSLTDIREQPVLRRVLLPSEMGAGSAVLPPRGEWSTTLDLAVADGAGRSRIVGYRLLAFYP